MVLVFKVSANGATIAAWNDDSNMLHIFDRSQKKLTKSIKIDETAIFENDQISLTPDGKLVVFKVEGWIFMKSLAVLVNRRKKTLFCYKKH